MRVADYIFKTLADQGVQNIFMVSGGGAMFLNDALGSEKRIQYVCTHHEQAAAIAAEGNSRVSGRLGVVSVTTGPGGTNALTGVIGQWLDSIPALYLSGQVKFETTIASCPDLGLRQLGDQEINIIDIVRPVTKYATLVVRPEDIRYELEKAISLATSGRQGPVWLDIPLNVQSAEIDPKLLRAYPQQPLGPVVTFDDQIASFIGQLREAHSPVIIAGHGIRQSNAFEQFRRLADVLRWPILGTLGGFDLLPTDHPCSVGRIGTIGTRSGNIALQNADFVLCLGSRNNIRQTSYNWENFAKRAKTFIAVDIDVAEMQKKNVRPTHTITADLVDFLEALSPFVEDLHNPEWPLWLDWCMSKKNAYPGVSPEWHSCSTGVHPYVFTEELTRHLPEQAVVSCANATPSITLFQVGIVKRGQRMFANSGCAAMGFGLPAAIGAAFKAPPHQTVVCLEGDGSLMMNVQELQTIKHYKLPIKLFLYNNKEYSSIRQTQDHFFNARHTGCDNASGVTFPEWEKIAFAFDIPYVKICSHIGMEKKIREILETPGPVFCDVELTPGYTFSPKLSSRRLEDGSIVSPSLEDMFPFLSPHEMQNNIYKL
ncbi:MAG: thiamine pyrophosphate-binding protein [bacterium]